MTGSGVGPLPLRRLGHLFVEGERAVGVHRASASDGIAFSWSRIEEGVGWTKSCGGMGKTRHRGRARVGWMFTLTAAACNLVRLPRLPAARSTASVRPDGPRAAESRAKTDALGPPNADLAATQAELAADRALFPQPAKGSFSTFASIAARLSRRPDSARRSPASLSARWRRMRARSGPYRARKFRRPRRRPCQASAR